MTLCDPPVSGIPLTAGVFRPWGVVYDPVCPSCLRHSPGGRSVPPLGCGAPAVDGLGSNGSQLGFRRLFVSAAQTVSLDSAARVL